MSLISENSCLARDLTVADMCELKAASATLKKFSRKIDAAAFAATANPLGCVRDAIQAIAFLDEIFAAADKSQPPPTGARG